MGGGRGGGGRDLPQGEQGEEEKQSRMEKKKRDALNEKTAVN